MKSFQLASVLFLLIFNSNAQTVQCLTEQSSPVANSSGDSKSINDLKIVRVNFHFMQNSSGGGNFRSYDDGDGRPFTGYDYARQHVEAMNNMCGNNYQLNLPVGNTLQILPKNYRFVLDAVYFVPNNSFYDYGNLNGKFTTYGMDKPNVMNIFISHSLDNAGGNASNLSATYNPTSGKCTDVRAYWRQYIAEMNNGSGIQDWVRATTTGHELGHLLTLSHTVLNNGAPKCGTGCSNFPVDEGGGPINTACDDFCADTPTAWEITQANNCTKHPACEWQDPSIYCSNNFMDYAGAHALSPCQIGRIHVALEGGLKQFLSCYAVGLDQTFCNLSYPKTSYFGRNVIVGNCGTLAHITNKNKIDLYYSSSVELNNFEVRADSEFEIILEPVCGF